MKRFIASLDQPFTAGGTGSLHDVLASQSGLKSNWPDLPALPPRKTIAYYAIDLHNETICKANTSALANEAARALGGSVRPVFIVDEVRYENI